MAKFSLNSNVEIQFQYQWQNSISMAMANAKKSIIKGPKKKNFQNKHRNARLEI
jgi:hypothetical protein